MAIVEVLASKRIAVLGAKFWINPLVGDQREFEFSIASFEGAGANLHAGSLEIMRDNLILGPDFDELGRFLSRKQVLVDGVVNGVRRDYEPL